jgi:hypothetical protein
VIGTGARLGDVRLERWRVEEENDWSWGFIYSRVRGEKKSLEEKFVSMKKNCQMELHFP